MDDWIGIVVALVVGLPLLGAAVLFDWRRRRAIETELGKPPLRGDDGVDSLTPDYVSQDTIDAMPRPGTDARKPEELRDGARLAFGHVDADFATAGNVAELQNARVLMVNDAISSMRELLGPLAQAASGQPLVIAASLFHPEVLATLRANRRAVGLPVVAVEANLAQLVQLQDLVGGQVLEGSDVKAGWIPADALGVALRWRSDVESTQILASRAASGPS